MLPAAALPPLCAQPAEAGPLAVVLTVSLHVRRRASSGGGGHGGVAEAPGGSQLPEEEQGAVAGLEALGQDLPLPVPHIVDSSRGSDAEPDGQTPER